MADDLIEDTDETDGITREMMLLARLRACRFSAVPFPLMREAANRIETLEAKVAALTADAGRYRAIRNDEFNPMCMFARHADDDLMVGVESMFAGAELDAKIDKARGAAIATKEGQQQP